MPACFLSQHGTLLAFGQGEDAFRHVSLERAGESPLVIADADAACLRAGALEGKPVAVRPSAAARSGLPRLLGIGPGRRKLVSLQWRDAYLCATGGGSLVRLSETVQGWEEFLAFDPEEIALLDSLGRGGWQLTRDGRTFGPGEIRVASEWALQVGDLAIDLRLQPKLADIGGVALLAEGWRIETLRHFSPLLVWRHDGTQEADEEIVLGLRSMVQRGGFSGPVRVATRLDHPALLARVPGLDATCVEIEAPPSMIDAPAFPDWRAAGGRAPILCLVNGAGCNGPLLPVLRALAAEGELAALPRTWSLEEPLPVGLFAADPAEPPDAVACSAAMIGVPDRRAALRLTALMSAIAANCPDRLATSDEAADDLLRYVVGRLGGAGTRLLGRHAATLRSPDDDVGATLLNFRLLPRSLRAGVMRERLALGQE